MANADVIWRDTEIFDEEPFNSFGAAQSVAKPLGNCVDAVRILIKENISQARGDVACNLCPAWCATGGGIADPDSSPPRYVRGAGVLSLFRGREPTVNNKPTYISKDGLGVTKAFLDYASPLVGELPSYASLAARRARP